MSSDAHEVTESGSWTIARDVVVIDGPEAASYLHGQVSQDIEDMSVGETRWSLLLEPRGRLEVFFRITRVDQERFVLDTDEGAGATLRSSLERFKLRTKADFSEPSWAMRTEIGEGYADGGLNLVVDAGWSVAATQSLGELSELGRLGGPALSSPAERSAYEVARCRTGLPAMGSEVLEGDIPNDTDLLGRAVSFSKGCYRGQELVERIDSRAGGRRALRRYEASGPVEPGPASDESGGTAEVRSAHRDGAATVGFVLAPVEATSLRDPNGVELVLRPI